MGYYVNNSINKLKYYKKEVANTLSNQKIIIDILGKSSLAIPTLSNEDQLKMRYILENVLSNYNFTTKDISIEVNDLQEKILLFISSKEIEGASKYTLYNYKLFLQKFADGIGNISTKNINVNHIRTYLATINKSMKQTTLANKVNILKSFFKWLFIEEYIPKNPMDKIKQPKVPITLRNPLNQAEIEQIRECCENQRLRAIFEFILATGCRLSEVTSLNIQDINWNEMSVKVRGKGNKERIVYFTQKAKYHLEKYINNRKDDNEALFATTRQPIHRLSNRRLQQEMRKLGKDSKMNRPIFPHLCRHSMASGLLNSGTSMVVIQNLLGHENISTTQRYAKISMENVKMEYRRHFNI